MFWMKTEVRTAVVAAPANGNASQQIKCIEDPGLAKNAIKMTRFETISDLEINHGKVDQYEIGSIRSLR